MHDVDPSDLDLRTEKVSALPIINSYLERLDISGLLSGRMESSPHMSTGSCLMVLLRNIIMEREPVYGIAEWTARFAPSLFGLPPDLAKRINDDRIGRNLDVLYDSDRGSMLTDLVVRIVRDFHINMDEFHNDSTTITFSGNYGEADGSDKRGKESLKIAHGHNKDHRQDLKQLLWTLTVSADHSVPVHYMALDGNTADTDTHIGMWDSLRRIAGTSDFIYVADSKLCTRENMNHISDNGGKFITVMPATRSESTWFHEYVKDHDIEWEDAFSRKSHGKEIEFRVFDSPIPSAEGFRIIWAWSSQKEDLDSGIRDKSIRDAVLRLDSLHATLNRRRMKKARIIKRAEEAIAGIPYIAYQIKETNNERFRKSGRGRPSPETKYTKTIETRYQISWKIMTDAIEKDSRSDGTFPLITNCMDDEASDILIKYKHQPMLEKRHEQLKTEYNVMPVLFKNVERIEAFLFLYFIAMTIQALIERDIRINMEKRDIASIPIYPEGRECSSPTAYRILSMFDNIMLNHILIDGREIKKIHTELTEMQKRILWLLDITEEVFWRDQ
ncbi:MAG: IS1634 family transposase [Candidatus Thermoplasmatota archaeon]|nr:IS1634 family transposase [Candidatus Thermoplasmatota archaeon]